MRRVRTNSKPASVTRTLSRPHSHAHQDDTNDVKDEVEVDGGMDNADNEATPDGAVFDGADTGTIDKGVDGAAAGCCLAVSHALSAASWSARV